MFSFNVNRDESYSGNSYHYGGALLSHFCYYVLSQSAKMVILEACATTHVTVALAYVTRRPETVRVDVLLAGRVPTVRQVTNQRTCPGLGIKVLYGVCVSVRVCGCGLCVEWECLFVENLLNVLHPRVIHIERNAKQVNIHIR